MMMPFALSGGEEDFGMTDFVMPDDACWEPAQMSVDRGAFLGHIQRFLHASVSKKVSRMYAAPGADYCLRDCDYRVYTLRDKAPVLRNVFNQRLVTEQGMAFTVGRKLASFLSPKLFVCPNAAVGLLVLPIIPDLGDHPDISLMVRFNYLLHKTDAKACRITIDTSPANRNYRKPAKSDGKCSDGSDHKLAETLGLDVPEGDRPSFTMSRLLGVMMRGVPYTRFNDDMLHVFTYIEIAPEVYKQDPDIPTHFTRLAMAISERYDVTSSLVRRVMQLGAIEDVFMGSTVSGGAIMTIVDGDSPQHHKEFVTKTLQQRYLWIYVMVLMQRHSLLNMTNWLINVDLDGDTEQTLRRVRRAVRRMSELTVNNRFSIISDYTQHNLFYQQCVDVLGIDALHTEVEQKLDTLNDLVEQLSIERKEQVDASKEYWQALLTVILTVLTMFSATNDGMEVLHKLGLPERCDTVATTIFLVVLLIAGIHFVGLKFYRLYSRRPRNKK